ncbi:hypothetical protein D3C77_576630 [compost metagenome]
MAYVEFIKKIKTENGRKAFLERNASKGILDWIKKRLVNIDLEALVEGNLWAQELVLFLEGNTE